MGILYIDFNYLFNKMLNIAIKEQRIKYNHEKMPKNAIILNKYNLVMDTIFSVAYKLDVMINKLSEKHDAVYIFNTRRNVARKMPSGYGSGYYIYRLKCFGTVSDLITTNLYTTKLLHDCVDIITKDMEVEIEDYSHKKAPIKQRQEKYRIRLANNSVDALEPFVKYYQKEYTDKWANYDTNKSANRKAKIAQYIKDFRLNVFLIQNHLEDSEINDIYNYLVKSCKLEHAVVDKFEVKDSVINILSNERFTDETQHTICGKIVDTGIQYFHLSKKDHKMTKSSIAHKLKQPMLKISEFKKSRGNMLDIVLNTKNNTWMNTIIDIDQDNYINMFTEHKQHDLYGKTHKKSILTYNFLQNYKGIGIVDENFYIKYLNRVLKSYSFKNFQLE